MKEKIPEPIFLSAPKAANLCGVSRNTICCWIRDGKLSSYKTAGGKYLIRPQDLIEFMRLNSMFVPPSLLETADKDEQQQAGKTYKSNYRQTEVEPAILVVDDDPDMRLLLRKTLETLGLPIVEAEDGYEALHHLTQNPLIALVILDLVMPGQHGTKTFEEIRSKFISLPVIICTGHTLEEAEKILGDQTPDLIVTKPFQTSYLQSVASTFLSDLGF
jgi:excisionase family DNA binding protein